MLWLVVLCPEIHFIYSQVSTNGLISFQNEFSYSPYSNYSDPFLPPLISPLWTDFNASISGSIYYRTTNNSLVLERIRNVLTEQNSTFVDYAPSLAFIVTWDRIPLSYDPSSIVSSIYYIITWVVTNLQFKLS